MRLSAIAAAAALALTLGTPAFAQSGAATAGTSASQDIRTSSLIGQTVIGDNGGELCKVEDVLVNPGKEPTVIVSVTSPGSSGRKLIAMPLSQVRVQNRKVTLPGVTKEALDTAPSFVYSTDNGQG